MIINTTYYDNVLSVTTDDGVTKYYRNIFKELNQNSPEFTELFKELQKEHDNHNRGTPLNPDPRDHSRNMLDMMETIERPTDDYHHGGLNYQGPLYAKHPDLNQDNKAT